MLSPGELTEVDLFGFPVFGLRVIPLIRWI